MFKILSWKCFYSLIAEYQSQKGKSLSTHGFVSSRSLCANYKNDLTVTSTKR